MEEGDLEGPLLPEVEEGGDDLPGHVEGDPGDMEKWEEMVEPEEVEVRNYTLVEVLSSRNGEANWPARPTSDGAPTEAFSAPIHRAGTGSPMGVRKVGVSRSC